MGDGEFGVGGSLGMVLGCFFEGAIDVAHPIAPNLHANVNN